MYVRIYRWLENEQAMSQEALLYTRARVNRAEEDRCVPYGVTSDVTGVTAKL